ncbi:MAG: T9SS type A sorting domain-containing protein [Paludibacter sp.]|nr:T9SS type A sorting domain-containing protein [Paludibacter sp.]
MKNLVTLSGRTTLLLVLTLCFWQNGLSQFIPGEGGSIPAFTPFTVIPGKVSGLYVQSSDRENIFFSTGTRPLVNLSFPYPTDYGATSYTLQFSTDNGATWGNYQFNGADLTTTGNNFSLNFAGDYTLRLLVNGGTYNGYTSNEVTAPLSGIDTKFNGWSLDESETLTGIMAPFVGRGLAASFIVNKLSDGSPVTGYLTYQWYRINPVTSEAIAINGATSLNYTTTLEDVGYRLMIRATGDGVNVGGFAQIMSGQRTVIPNKSFITNLSSTGFTLNLFKTVSGLTIDGLWLYDYSSHPVVINSLTQGANAAIYNVGATLDFLNGPFYLNTAIPNFWCITTEISAGGLFTITMEGVVIDFTAGTTELPVDGLSIYPIPASNGVNFKVGVHIRQAELITLNGAIAVQSAINSKFGSLNTSTLSSGIYFLRLTTDNGVMNRKIEIKR